MSTQKPLEIDTELLFKSMEARGLVGRVTEESRARRNAATERLLAALGELENLRNPK